MEIFWLKLFVTSNIVSTFETAHSLFLNRIIEPRKYVKLKRI
ncbi:MAG: hypothetical protein CH6_0511 [Candidatus Kapaibacterium sp.]|nr:MAG: hypothetical protein CH6_0511 [Candidatus Kapabacteria bacterium]